MGKVAFVFPGQGSQKVGMGREACDASDAARAVFDAADEALGDLTGWRRDAGGPVEKSLSKLCFEGPEDELKLTANTQPAVLTVSVALLRAFGERPDVTAGHSLGEYSAHVAAGTLRFEDAVRVVRQRGRYMQEAVPVGEGAMAAVIGAERDVVDSACHDVDGVVEPVNYNSPGQIVIAGAKDAVDRAIDKLQAAGARAMPLPVSAPFHSSLMRPAEEQLRPHLAELELRDAEVPVYVNVDATPVTTAEAARDALERQVSRPVRWEDAIRRMMDDGVDLFVEIGPGRVLSGLIGRIDRKVAKVSIQKPDDFDKARAAIAEARA